jgi:HMG (high mobility group) box
MANAAQFRIECGAPVDHAYCEEEAHTFDWTEPFDRIATATTSCSIDELDPNVCSDNDGERSIGANRLEEGEPLEQQREQCVTHAERKRSLDEMLQSAPLRRKKKPKSLPKRPLSAYNLYFQSVRAKLNSEGGSKVGFHELGKIVGKKWKLLPESEHKIYKELAIQDTERYRKEMDKYKKMEATMKDKGISEKTIDSVCRGEGIQTARPSSHVPPYASTSSTHDYRPRPSRNAAPYTVYQTQSPYVHSWGNSGAPPPRFHPPCYQPYDSVGTPVLMEGIPPNRRMLPPGSVVHLPDEIGELRPYTVQYAMVTMSREEARDYLDKLKP